MKRATADRYARSLLAVALREGDPERVGDELAGFVRAVDESAELKRVLANPAVPSPRKRALVGALAERTVLSPMVAKLLLMLAERDRLEIVTDVLSVYRERLLEQQQAVRAEVTTAVPLDADRAETLARSLAGATGKRVTLDLKVDPAIIGGIVTRIGSVVYDGSVVRQLERIKQRLTQP